MKNDEKHFDCIDVEVEFEKLTNEEIEKMIEEDWVDYQKKSANPMGVTSKILEEYEEWFKGDDKKKKHVYNKLIFLNQNSKEFQSEEIKKQFVETLKCFK